MSQPQVIDVPEKMRPTWRLFVEAVTEKPTQFAAAFAILCKQCGRTDVADHGTLLLRRLCEYSAADVATTMLAYLPPEAQKLVVKQLNADKAARDLVLQQISGSQKALKEALCELIAEGKHPHLQVLKGVAA
ncbi:MAG: hypothetical protein KIT75_03470 [Planctomycetota bacterium]|nr:hypothetical protein [Planctomycetota bacterium]